MNEESNNGWNGLLFLGVGVGALALLVLVAGNVFPVGNLFSSGVSEDQVAALPQPPQPIITESGLFMYNVEEGTGAEVQPGMKVTVDYRGTLDNGTEFDSSYSRNQPLTFTVGKGEVIKGWDEGIVGMKVGGTRMMLVPPNLGYGEAGNGPVPPNALMTFEVKLLSAEGGAAPGTTTEEPKAE